jgi:hypothetical protein
MSPLSAVGHGCHRNKDRGEVIMKTILASAVVGIGILMAVPASATTCPNRKLQFFSDDTGGILWQQPRVDSPLDTNNSRLMGTVLFQDGDDYFGAYTDCSGIEGLTLGQVRNLSFDFMNETGNPFVHIGAGAPRYSVDLDKDGDGFYDVSAFLAAYYCPAVLPEDIRWSRADFTGRTLAGCTIFVDGETFVSNGTTSAWGLFAAAHPTYKVMAAYLLMDEAGTVFVDRLAFHSLMFTGGSGSGITKNCPSESSC